MNWLDSLREQPYLPDQIPKLLSIYDKAKHTHTKDKIKRLIAVQCFYTEYLIAQHHRKDPDNVPDAVMDFAKWVGKNASALHETRSCL